MQGLVSLLWTSLKTFNRGPSDIGTVYNRPLYNGHRLRFQIFTFSIVSIHLQPPRRGQPLYKGQNKWIYTVPNVFLVLGAPLQYYRTLYLQSFSSGKHCTSQWATCRNPGSRQVHSNDYDNTTDMQKEISLQHHGHDCYVPIRHSHNLNFCP